MALGATLRISLRRSKTLITCVPGNDVSTSMAGHSRLNSSTILRVRNRVPLDSTSDMKSMDQRSLPRSVSSTDWRSASRIRFFLRLRACNPFHDISFTTPHDLPDSLPAQQNMRSPIAITTRSPINSMIRSRRSSIIPLSGLYCQIERLRLASHQARRCESSCVANMCDTKFRFPAGRTTFAKRHPSTPRCLASVPPKASSA